MSGFGPLFSVFVLFSLQFPFFLFGFAAAPILLFFIQHLLVSGFPSYQMCGVLFFFLPLL